jgi:transcriptional regulator with XRE-family HTH domain
MPKPAMPPIEDEDALRQLVVRARAVRGLTLGGAAERSGVNQQTWRNWEGGVSNLTPRVATAIATKFGWAYDWPWHPPRDPAEGMTKPTTDEKLQQILEQLVVLTEAIQRLADD